MCLQAVKQLLAERDAERDAARLAHEDLFRARRRAGAWLARQFVSNSVTTTISRAWTEWRVAVLRSSAASKHAALAVRTLCLLMAP